MSLEKNLLSLWFDDEFINKLKRLAEKENRPNVKCTPKVRQGIKNLLN